LYLNFSIVVYNILLSYSLINIHAIWNLFAVTLGRKFDAANLGCKAQKMAIKNKMITTF